MRGRFMKSLRFADAINTSKKQHALDILSRGRACGASVPSEFQHMRKGKRKVSREERSKMVEEFVEKYRSLNGGKFPTATLAIKQVGGSFYRVRYLIQKLQLENKSPTVRERLVSDLTMPSICNDYNHHEMISPSLADMKDISTSELLHGDTHVQISDFESNSSKVDSILENDGSASLEEPTSTTALDIERDNWDKSNLATTCSTSGVGETTVPSEALYTEDISSSDSVIMGDHTRSVVEDACEEPSAGLKANNMLEQKQEVIVKELHQLRNHYVPKSEISTDIPESIGTSASIPKKHTVWSNLKSFADGIRKFWRNL